MAKLAARPRKPRPFFFFFFFWGTPRRCCTRLTSRRARSSIMRRGREPASRPAGGGRGLPHQPRASPSAEPAPRQHQARDAQRAACVDAGEGAALGLVHSPPHPEERPKTASSQVGYSRLAHSTIRSRVNPRSVDEAAGSSGRRRGSRCVSWGWVVGNDLSLPRIENFSKVSTCSPRVFRSPQICSKVRLIAVVESSALGKCFCVRFARSGIAHKECFVFRNIKRLSPPRNRFSLCALYSFVPINF